MAASTTVNGRTVVHRKSSGVLATFPDVCLTPTPGGPVPVPYPNVARSADLADGSRTVTVDGCAVAVQGSVFSRSTGDEPGTQKGVVSRAQRGEARFQNWSFDVKIEGKGACRLLDPMTSNGGSPTNTPPAAEVQPPLVVPPTPAPELEDLHRLRARMHYAPPNVNDGSIMDAAVFNRGYRLRSADSGAVVDFNPEGEQYQVGLSDVPDPGEYTLTFFPFWLGPLGLKRALDKGRDRDQINHLAAETKRLEADLESLSKRIKKLIEKAESPDAVPLGLAKGRVDTARTLLTRANETAKGADGDTGDAALLTAARGAADRLQDAARELRAAAAVVPPVLSAAPLAEGPALSARAPAIVWRAVQTAVIDAAVLAETLDQELSLELDS